MKPMYQAMIAVLSIFVAATSFAGQEGYGLPPKPHFKPELVCSPFHAANGQILMGARAPELDSALRLLYLKTQALAPAAQPQYTALQFVKQIPMGNGDLIELYQAKGVVVRIVLRGATVLSGTIQAGAAMAVCQPVVTQK